MAPWCRKFSRLYVLFICYGTAVEHRSLLNRSGICDGINRCNIFLFMQPFWVLKTSFNLVKIHLLFRIIPLIQWSVMLCRPCFNRFWGLKYIPRLFSEYMLTFRVEEPMKICVTNYIRNINNYIWNTFAKESFSKYCFTYCEASKAILLFVKEKKYK